MDLLNLTLLSLAIFGVVATILWFALDVDVVQEILEGAIVLSHLLSKNEFQHHQFLELCVGKAKTFRIGTTKLLEAPLDLIANARKFTVGMPLKPAVTIAVVAPRTREPLAIFTDGNHDRTAVGIDTSESFGCLAMLNSFPVDNSV